MAFGCSPRPSQDHAPVALPSSYTRTLLFWVVPFATIVVFLVVFYIYVLIVSLAMILREWSHEGQNDGAMLICGIVGVMTGSYLLAFLVKTLRAVHVTGGVRLAPGVLPELETLITECAAQAGVAPPDGVFVTLEANARAYSSGRYALHKQLNSCVLIGAPLLAHLSRSELAAVLHHEFGHLILRRHSWAVSLHCKIVDFLVRFQRAQGRSKGCAAAIVLLPIVVVRLFFAAFAWSLRGLSKQDWHRPTKVRNEHYLSAPAANSLCL
jgi:Zn-dependent protease with chaperone function